jgi:hypothetical protein
MDLHKYISKQSLYKADRFEHHSVNIIGILISKYNALISFIIHYYFRRKYGKSHTASDQRAQPRPGH